MTCTTKYASAFTALIAVALGAACHGSNDAATTRAPAEPRAPREGAVQAPSAVAPQGAAARRASAESVEACARCHAGIAKEWRESYHRVAFTDASFQASLAIEEPEEHAFCVRCHAPAAARELARTGGSLEALARDALRTRSGDLLDGATGGALARSGDPRDVSVLAGSGVDCVSCHATPHADIARYGREGETGREGRDHKARAGREAREAGTRVCAGCHEFTFDDGRAELVQKTHSEHAASAFAGVACADCHMPERDGHKDHRFMAGHAPEAIRRAVHVSVARSGDAALRVRIRADAGHAFPTGDMFRRARLVIFADDTEGRIVADAERTFGRTWGSVQGGAHAGRRTETSDTRIRGAWEGEISLDVSPAPIARVRWTLLYERVLAMRGDRASVVSSDALADGELTW